MRCNCCGEKIEDEPIWRKGKTYCSEECADIDMEEDDEKEKEEE